MGLISKIELQKEITKFRRVSILLAIMGVALMVTPFVVRGLYGDTPYSGLYVACFILGSYSFQISLHDLRYTGKLRKEGNKLSQERKVGKHKMTVLGIGLIGLSWVVAWVSQSLAAGILPTILTIVMLIQVYRQRPQGEPTKVE